MLVAIFFWVVLFYRVLIILQAAFCSVLSSILVQLFRMLKKQDQVSSLKETTLF